MQPELSPVLVFGAPHSGTTILYRMLAYHPDLTWFSQLSLGNGEIPGRRTRPGARLLDVEFRRIPHRWQKEESRLRRLVVPLPSQETTIWKYLLEDEKTEAERVRSCLASFSERLGGRRIVAQWPDFYRFLDLLQSACPDALYVHIVRDGRPLAFSIREKFEVVASSITMPSSPPPITGSKCSRASAPHGGSICSRSATRTSARTSMG